MSNRPSFPSINIGDAPPPLVCGPLTRTQFVRYAGASHDFNPNHHDEVYAKASGNKAVFGMGMLAGGYCARLLTDWFGDGALRGSPLCVRAARSRYVARHGDLVAIGRAAAFPDRALAHDRMARPADAVSRPRLGAGRRTDLQRCGHREA